MQMGGHRSSSQLHQAINARKRLATSTRFYPFASGANGIATTPRVTTAGLARRTSACRCAGLLDLVVESGIANVTAAAPATTAAIASHAHQRTRLAMPPRVSGSSVRAELPSSGGSGLVAGALFAPATHAMMVPITPATPRGIALKPPVAAPPTMATTLAASIRTNPSHAGT